MKMAMYKCADLAPLSANLQGSTQDYIISNQLRLLMLFGCTHDALTILSMLLCDRYGQKEPFARNSVQRQYLQSLGSGNHRDWGRHCEQEQRQGEN